MLNVLKQSGRAVAALAVVVAMSFAGASAHAAEGDGKGKITGKVIGKDGAGVAGAQVRLMEPGAGGKGKKVKNQAADADKGKGKGERQEPVAKTMSEADGSYTLADVAAGDYVLMARTKDKMQAREKVTVKAGEELKVDLKLQEPGQGKKKKKGE